jgi:hypothetical protein
MMHTPEATATTRRHRLIASTLIAGTFTTALTIGTATARAEAPQWVGTVVEDRHAYRLDGWQTINYQNINCPTANPYLIREHKAPRRHLPAGITVEEPGGVGVSGSFRYKNDDTKGYIVGVKDMSLTNWALGKTLHAVVTLHCSDNPADGYTYLTMPPPS